MEPVDPCIDVRLVRSGSRPIVVAEKQDEYRDLPSVKTTQAQTITRWTFTDEERRRIFEGEDLYITILGQGAINPIMPTVGVVDWTPCALCGSPQGSPHDVRCPWRNRENG